jgi:5-methylcytosine-specific restriction endonuclease McrA
VTLGRRWPAPRRSGPRRRPRLAGERPDWGSLTEALWARSDGLCESCGLPLPAHESNWHRHHRQRREFGDDTLPNLVALHPECHVLTPWSVHQRPDWAKERGLIVPSWARPESASLELPDGRLVMLTKSGRYQTIGGWDD